MTDSPAILEQKMKILMGLRGYSIIKIEEKQALWKINSENAVTVDVSFPAELWEVKHKGKVVNDWKKDPTLPANTRDMIQTLDDEFQAAWNEAVDNGWIIETEQPVKVPEKIEPETVQSETPKIDPEIEEKNRLEREENERRLAMAEEAKRMEDSQNAHLKQVPQKQTAEKSEEFTDRPTEYVEAPAPKTGEVNLFEVLNKICKNDLMQIFGPTGTGKTSLCTKLALDSKLKGKSVLYIDTEHNMNDDQIAAMQKAGIKYEFIKKFPKLCDYVKRLPSLSKYNVVVIDSIGAPALAAFCRSDMRGKGDVLQKLIWMSDDLKEYATDNNSLVVATNQPESSMNKGENDILEPFGEKSRYYYKEILKTNYAAHGRKTGKTTLVLRAHRSRFMGIDTNVCTMEVTDKGVKVIQ